MNTYNRRTITSKIFKKVIVVSQAICLITILLASTLTVNYIHSRFEKEKKEFEELQSFQFPIDTLGGWDFGLYGIAMNFGLQITFGTVFAILCIGTALALGLAAIFSYIGIYIIPFLLLLPIMIPLSMKWKNPAKFLIFRPFNRTRVTGSLKKIVRNEISEFGHVYTLADSEIKVPWYVKIPIFLGQLSFFHFRNRTLYIPNQLVKLAKAMNHRIRRNINWYLSFSKLFSVNCTDMGWRSTVAFLTPMFDGFILDLSHPSINITWEIQLLDRIGALNHTIFLVHKDRKKEALQVLNKELCTEDDVSNKVLIYDEHGRTDSEALQSKLVSFITDPVRFHSESVDVSCPEILGSYPDFKKNQPEKARLDESILPPEKNKRDSLVLKLVFGLVLLLLLCMITYTQSRGLFKENIDIDSLGLEFVLIPSGTFLMGSPSDEEGRNPDESQHKVTISKPFYMQRTEVTVKQWEAVMGKIPVFSDEDCESCPVQGVVDCQIK